MGVTAARRATLAAAVLAAALGVPAAPDATAGALGAPQARAGRVVWGAASSGPDSAAAAAGAALDPGAEAFARGDSLEGWRLRAAEPALPAVALRELARARIARGQAAAADSALADPRLAASPWAWDALRLRAAIALAAADTARAESLLAGAGVDAWPDADRAARQLERATLALARGREGEAGDLARLTLRLYPSLAASGPAVRVLEALAARRGGALEPADERAAAESDVLRGARASAARRLRNVRPRAPAEDRWRLALRLAEVLRASRMPLSARAAADTALALAPAGEPRARVALERARALRDAGATDSSLAAYARIGRTAGAGPLRTTAWWEYAREAEDASRWREALEGHRRVAHSGERRADDARVRAGLVQFARGEADSARHWWRRSDSEAARFWLGVALRGADRAASDSLLSALAALPGYGFYRAAARETLGVAGWRDRVAAAVPDTGGSPAARALLAWGLADEGLRELSRAREAARAAAGEWLGAAAVAFGGGRLAPGTRWAERAFAAAVDAGDDSLAWAVVPWAYPPAFEAGITAAESLGIEPALFWALVRQESRFDPAARSRSNALGLAQLKLPAAGDAAAMLRAPRPTEASLLEPATSLRLGARYLARMLERFGGVPAVALAAYNAGPGTIRRDWRDLLARGGEALYAEFASNADSQDYARRILGFRQAYRELRPTSAP